MPCHFSQGTDGRPGVGRKGSGGVRPAKAMASLVRDGAVHALNIEEKRRGHPRHHVMTFLSSRRNTEKPAFIQDAIPYTQTRGHHVANGASETETRHCSITHTIHNNMQQLGGTKGVLDASFERSVDQAGIAELDGPSLSQSIVTGTLCYFFAHPQLQRAILCSSCC